VLRSHVVTSAAQRFAKRLLETDATIRLFGEGKGLSAVEQAVVGARVFGAASQRDRHRRVVKVRQLTLSLIRAGLGLLGALAPLIAAAVVMMWGNWPSAPSSTRRRDQRRAVCHA
jgi:hypothetical protein